MTQTALITGASSGIGKELARYHASKGGDLIITARREAELEALKSELEAAHKVKVSTIAMDLSGSGQALELYKQVRALGDVPDILINNAGFGGHGDHITRKLDDEMSMIDLNIKALVTLTHEFGRDMSVRGSGKILNVGSTAGFLPGPQQAVYFASKAFVNSFSQAVDQELRKSGVSCTVLAPGYVETEFAQTADLLGTQLVKGGGKSARSVAKIGYDAMMAGKLVKINELGLSFALNWLVPFVPRRILLTIADKIQSKAA